MTKQHFQRAAEIVAEMGAGNWTFERPTWADGTRYDASHTSWDEESEWTARYTRAVWTAEAFIQLFTEYNPRFDRARFLYACGLGPKPAPKQKG